MHFSVRAVAATIECDPSLVLAETDDSRARSSLGPTDCVELVVPVFLVAPVAQAAHQLLGARDGRSATGLVALDLGGLGQDNVSGSIDGNLVRGWVTAWAKASADASFSTNNGAACMTSTPRQRLPRSYVFMMPEAYNDVAVFTHNQISREINIFARIKFPSVPPTPYLTRLTIKTTYTNTNLNINHHGSIASSVRPGEGCWPRRQRRHQARCDEL